MSSEAEVEILKIQVSSEWDDTPRSGLKTFTNCLNKLKKLEVELSTKKFANMPGISRTIKKISDAVKPLENIKINNVVNSLSRLPKALSRYTEEDSNTFARCAGAIRDGLGKLDTESNVGDVATKLGRLQKVLASYKDVDDAPFTNAIMTLNTVLPHLNIKDSTEQLSKSCTQINKLPKILGEYNTIDLTGFKRVYVELEKMVNLMKELNNVPNLKDFIASVKKLGEIKQINNPKGMTAPEIQEAPDLSPPIIKNLTLLERLKEKFRELPKIVNLSARISKHALKGLGKTAKAVLDIVTGAFKRIGTRLMGIIMYRVLSAIINHISSAIKEGINNLYQYSKVAKGAFAESMDKIASSSLYVKNAFGSLVGILVQKVAPYLEWVFDKIADCVNKMSEFYAKMTGAESWTRAKKVPIEFAEATENAVNSTEKLKRAILGFDKLNILDFGTQLEKASKAKAPSAPKYSTMFEEVRLVDNGSIDRMRGKYEGLYQSLVNCKNSAGDFFSQIFSDTNKESILDSTLKCAEGIARALEGVIKLLNTLRVPDLFVSALAGALDTAAGLANGLKIVGNFIAHPIDFSKTYFNMKWAKEHEDEWINMMYISDAIATKEQLRSILTTGRMFTMENSVSPLDTYRALMYRYKQVKPKMTDIEKFDIENYIDTVSHIGGSTEKINDEIDKILTNAENRIMASSWYKIATPEDNPKIVGLQNQINGLTDIYLSKKNENRSIMSDEDFKKAFDNLAKEIHELSRQTQVTVSESNFDDSRSGIIKGK